MAAPKPVTATLEGVALTTKSQVREALVAHNRDAKALVLWSLADVDHGRPVEKLPAAGVEVLAPRIGDDGTAELASVALVVEGVRGWKLG